MSSIFIPDVMRARLSMYSADVRISHSCIISSSSLLWWEFALVLNRPGDGGGPRMPGRWLPVLAASQKVKTPDFSGKGRKKGLGSTWRFFSLPWPSSSNVINSCGSHFS